MGQVKYVECRHNALVRCKYKDGTAVDFYPFILNKYTGQPEHTGFTEIAVEDLKRLEVESKVFAGFEKQKLLIVRDEVPASAMTPQGLIASKDQQIADLQAKLAAAGDGSLLAEKDKEIEALKAQVADGHKAVEALKAELAKKKKKGKAEAESDDEAGESSEAEEKPAQF
jgi:hypothetical protein